MSAAGVEIHFHAGSGGEGFVGVDVDGAGGTVGVFGGVVAAVEVTGGGAVGEAKRDGVAFHLDDVARAALDGEVVFVGGRGGDQTERDHRQQEVLSHAAIVG